jgi:hypothetical protein
LTIKLKKINTENRKEQAVIKILKEAGEKRNFHFEMEALCILSPPPTLYICRFFPGLNFAKKIQEVYSIV